MKLNKKGFTLIELLAVVVILLAISVIAISSISAAIERNKEKQNEAKIEVIISYVKLYREEHKNELSGNGAYDSGCIEVEILGLSDAEILDADGNQFTGAIRYSNNGTKYEYVEECPPM